MMRISRNKCVEAMEYVGYCEATRGFIDLDGIRTWKLLTGRNVIFYHGQIRCSCSGECCSTHGCLLATEALREWEVEANEKLDEVREEMLSWK